MTPHPDGPELDSPGDKSSLPGSPGGPPGSPGELLRSPVLQTVSRAAVPVTIIVSLIIFNQGHNLPGGGFIGGVLAAAAGAMHLMAFGVEGAARWNWWKLSVLGLLISIMTGTVPFLLGEAFMNHTELHPHLPLIGSFHVPTAAFYDAGVYLIVVGMLMTIFVELGLENRE